MSTKAHILVPCPAGYAMVVVNWDGGIHTQHMLDTMQVQLEGIDNLHAALLAVVELDYIELDGLHGYDEPVPYNTAPTVEAALQASDMEFVYIWDGHRFVNLK